MFLHVSVILSTGGACVVTWGVYMVAPGGMHGCSGGICGCSQGGMHGCLGACVVFFDEIRSMSGR